MELVTPVHPVIELAISRRDTMYRLQQVSSSGLLCRPQSAEQVKVEACVARLS